jgi:hypothetical protein
MDPVPRPSGSIRVRAVFEFGQWYAIATGREVSRLKGRGRSWRAPWRAPAVVGMGATSDAAIEDVAGLLRTLRRYHERQEHA